MKLFDHEAERAAIGILAGVSTYDVGRARLLLEESRLAPRDMSFSLHGPVLDATGALLMAGLPADQLGLSAKLLKVGARVQGEWLAQLLSDAVAVPDASFPGLASNIRQLAARRRMIEIAQAALRTASDPKIPVEEAIGQSARDWAGLTHEDATIRSGAEHLEILLSQLDAAQRGEQIRCLLTGIDRWDQVLGGLEVGVPTFIGSLPSVGKSSLVATMIDNLCRAGTKVGLFSMEDLATWLPSRLLSRDAGVPQFVMSKRPMARVQMERVADACPALHERLKNLWVDERSLLTAAALVQAARYMIRIHGVKVIFIDHLGKMRHRSERDSDGFDLAIEESLNQLTALAKEERIALVICAHLKERGPDSLYQQPDLSSFARTAFIERDARNAVGLYLEKGEPNQLNVAVLKQTNGVAGTVFDLGRLKEAGLVQSINGRLSGIGEDVDEAALLNNRDRYRGDA